MPAAVGKYADITGGGLRVHAYLVREFQVGRGERATLTLDDAADQIAGVVSTLTLAGPESGDVPAYFVLATGAGDPPMGRVTIGGQSYDGVMVVRGIRDHFAGVWQEAS